MYGNSLSVIQTFVILDEGDRSSRVEEYNYDNHHFASKPEILDDPVASSFECVLAPRRAVKAEEHTRFLQGEGLRLRD